MIWLSLNQMADLFQRDKSVISKHIRNVFKEGELSPDSTVAKFATVQTEGSRSERQILKMPEKSAMMPLFRRQRLSI